MRIKYYITHLRIVCYAICSAKEHCGESGIDKVMCGCNDRSQGSEANDMNGPIR